MSNEAGLNAQEQQVESLLEQFQPCPDRRLRDRLIFQAGRRSAGSVRLWQGISGVLTVLFVGALALQWGPGQVTPVDPPPLVVQQPSAPNGAVLALNERELDDQAYIRLRSKVLSDGLDALPEANPGQAMVDEHRSYGDALKHLRNI